jgi:O-antigen ligase
MKGGEGFKESFAKGGLQPLFGICLIISAFWLPITAKGIGVPLALLSVVWIFLPKSISKKKGSVILLFSAIYLFHLIAMLYTEDVARGMRDLGQKASLLLFPLVLGTVSEKALPDRKLIFGSFILGLLVAVVLSFIGSYQDYSESGLVTDFFMSNFPFAHHPSYFALFLNVAIGMLIIGFPDKKESTSFYLAKFFISLIMVAGVIYSASKMGFIQFVFLLAFIAVYWGVNRLFNKQRILLLSSIAILFGVLFFVNPVAKNRIFYTVELMENEKVAASETETESTVARLTTWKITIEEILKYPFGVGTGDIQDVLDARYRKEGYNLLADKGLNPHNVFLQIGLAQGIIAVLIFGFSLLYPFFRIWNRKDWVYALFLLSILMHFMVESMLEKGSGVIFFAMFNTFLFFSPTHLNSSSTEPS